MTILKGNNYSFRKGMVHMVEISDKLPTPCFILSVCGIDLGEFNAKLLAIVEELTLYIINMQKQIDILHETQSTQTK